MVSRLMASTMPTIFSVATMVMAMSVIIRYSMAVTGRCCERAKVLSNAMFWIGRRRKVKRRATMRASPPSSHRSALSMARMLPKRKEGRSGMNPGVRKQQMMPTLIPRVQNMAMAESFRTFFLRDIHCTPKALRMAKTMAESIGLIPVNTPMPMPPKEAWVMPPLMNTNRRVTM